MARPSHAVKENHQTSRDAGLAESGFALPFRLYRPTFLRVSPCRGVLQSSFPFLKPPSPEWVPGGRVSIRIDRMDSSLAIAFFAMFDDRREFGQRHQFERFNQIFLFAGTSCTVATTAASVGSFPDHSFSDEISGAFRTRPVGRLENDTVS